MFICGGAFAGIDKVIEARGKGTSIGFGAEVKDAAEEKSTTELLHELIPEDLVKYGLIPEFVGRLPVIATLEELDEDALVTILTEPKNAFVKQYKKLFGLEGVELVFEDSALKAVANEAIQRKTGARGLRSILENLLLDTMFDLPDLEDINEIVIDEDVVKGKKDPIQKKGKKKTTKKSDDKKDEKTLTAAS